jgi:hypothetical protein
MLPFLTPCLEKRYALLGKNKIGFLTNVASVVEKLQLPLTICVLAAGSDAQVRPYLGLHGCWRQVGQEKQPERDSLANLWQQLVMPTTGRQSDVTP